MVKASRYFGGRSRWYGRVPITITLATAIGLLVLVTVGAVFGVGVWLAQKNTFDLLSDNAHQAIAADVNQIVQQLRPAEHQAQFLAHQITRGVIDPSTQEQFGRMLIGALAAGLQIDAVMFIDTNFQSFTAGRERERDDIDLEVVDYSKDPLIRKLIEDASKQG